MRRDHRRRGRGCPAQQTALGAWWEGTWASTFGRGDFEGERKRERRDAEGCSTHGEREALESGGGCDEEAQLGGAICTDRVVAQVELDDEWSAACNERIRNGRHPTVTKGAASQAEGCEPKVRHQTTAHALAACRPECSAREVEPAECGAGREEGAEEDGVPHA